MLSPASLIRPTPNQTAAADAALAADIATMEALAARTSEFSSELEAALPARRRETSAALEEAFGLVEDAFAVLAAGLVQLRNISAGDLQDGMIDAADTARAEARRIAA